MNLVILDRDGVINEDAPDYVKTPEEWKPIPGSLEAVAKLHQAGFYVAIASNQSAVGRGLITLETLSRIQRKMDQALDELGAGIDALFFCPHVPGTGCNCRKPKPGLLEDVGRRLNVSLDDVPFIGDTQKDVDAATAVGARPMLVLTGKGRATAQSPDFPRDVPVYEDLAAAVDALLESA